MAKLKPPVNNKDHFQGKAKSPIELVEYGDYQCPHCGYAYPIIKNIQKKLGAKLKFVFRNFPLAEAHPNAMHAAIAAEAASGQNKFWNMHDILFENQSRLDDVYLVRYAEFAGMEVTKFESDFKKPEFTEKVETDFESGVRSGVNGTPSFFVNGEKYDGDWEEEPFLFFLQSI